jgi:hypothetical protein
MIEVSEKALGEFKRVLSGEDRGPWTKIKAFVRVFLLACGPEPEL